MPRNIVVSISEELYQRMKQFGFLNGSTPHPLTNDWLVGNLWDSVKAYKAYHCKSIPHPVACEELGTHPAAVGGAS